MAVTTAGAMKNIFAECNVIATAPRRIISIRPRSRSPERGRPRSHRAAWHEPFHANARQIAPTSPHTRRPTRKHTAGMAAPRIKPGMALEAIRVTVRRSRSGRETVDSITQPTGASSPPTQRLATAR